MDLNEYQQRYFNFAIAIDQTQLIAISAGEALKDFPNNLPKEVLNELITTFEEMNGLLRKAVEAIKASSNEEGDKRASFKEASVPLTNPFAQPTISLLISQSLTGNHLLQPFSNLNFDSLIHSQELAMQLAHLDAFLSDSLRAMCKVDSRILHNNKKTTWDNILKAGNWDTLIETLIEDYLYEFGWKSIKERVQFLEAEHGLKINCPVEELEFLDDAEKLRHIVIHNGSRVSREYLNRTHRNDIKLGDVIPVEYKYARRVAHSLRALGSDVFLAVAVKFFKADKKALAGIVPQRIKRKINS